jgi:hypothetical protein
MTLSAQHDQPRSRFQFSHATQFSHGPAASQPTYTHTHGGSDGFRTLHAVGRNVTRVSRRARPVVIRAADATWTWLVVFPGATLGCAGGLCLSVPHQRVDRWQEKMGVRLLLFMFRWHRTHCHPACMYAVFLALHY